MARRNRRRSFGCIEDYGKDANGVTRWRLRWREDGKRRTEVVHGSKRDAEHRLAEIHVRVGADRESGMTFAMARERFWLPDARERLAASTFANYDGAWRSYVGPRWGDVPVAAIRPLDVQEWLLTLSGHQAQMALNVMRPVLERCVMFEVIGSNPLSARYSKPSTRVRASDGGVYGLGELPAVWRAVKGSPVEAAVLLMAFGSCRVGESLGARAAEVALMERPAGTVALAPIVRQVENRTGEVVDTLKNAQSRRTAVVPGPMGARLAQLSSEALGRGEEWLCDDGYGRPVPQGDAMREYRRLLTAAGVEPHPMKNLRKSWETTARWTLRLDSLVIEKLMGHVGDGVTAQHYDRPMAESMADLVADAYAAHPYADDWDI